MPFFGGGQQQQRRRHDAAAFLWRRPAAAAAHWRPGAAATRRRPVAAHRRPGAAANCRRPGRSRLQFFSNYQPTGQIEYTATAVYYNTDSTLPRLRNAEARDGPPVELDGRPEDVRAKRKRTDSDERMDKIRGRTDATRLSCGLNSGFATVIEPTMIEPPVFEPTTKKPHTGMKVHQSFTLY